MKKNIILTLFILIILIASFLRFFLFTQVPPSPDWDEASLGYNAYSIMETGKDEYGKLLPVVLRSFDDYKPALYTYFIIPFIKIFGLSLTAVRFPSALFGVLTVIATYSLTKNLLDLNGKDQKNTFLALLASFLLAISPWHIQFSRIAFESNVGVAFNVFSGLFLVKSLKNSKFLILAALFMGLSFYIYQSEKVFAPLLLFAFVIIFKDKILAFPKKYLFSAIILGLIVSLPMVFYVFTDKSALSRAQGVSVFSDKTPFLKENVQRIAEDQNNADKLGLILDNRRIEYVKAIANGYISHFDLNWLFINGDIARHHAPGIGLMYFWELPFLLMGIYGLVFGNYARKAKLFLFSWFLITPIPASITSGVPHAVRTLNFLPIIPILAAIGLISFFTLIKNNNILKNKILKLAVYGFFAIFVIGNIFYYLDQYFVQQNYYNSEDWQYGYEKAVFEVKNIEGNYDKIIVTNKPYLDQSYMFFLFYLKYPPLLYQETASSGGFRENHYFGKYEFRPIDWEKENKSSRYLFIGRANDFPDNVKIIKVINFLNGKPAIKIVEG